MVGRKRVRNPASKDMILEAAHRVVTKRGPAHLTLDAVAAEAGLSKGGLLYNFPSKQSLVHGMILAHVEQYRRAFEALRTEGEGPNSVIAALVRARKQTGVERSTGLAMLTGLAENPDLLTPMREEMRTALRDIRENASDPTIATMIWLAIDGLEFLELLDISPFDPDGREAIEAEMVSLLETGGGSGTAPATGVMSGRSGGSSKADNT